MGGTQRTKEKTTHMMNDPFIFKADIKTYHAIQTDYCCPGNSL